MVTGEETIGRAFDPQAGDIQSRRIVLDYLLNRDNYIN
jgi:hypothetical protein